MGSLVSRLSPDMHNLNSRDSGGGRESGEFYHVKEFMGRENVIEHGHNQLLYIFCTEHLCRQQSCCYMTSLSLIK